MKRVKGVEDLNIRIVRAQGIVGVGVTIRTCTDRAGRRHRTRWTALDLFTTGVPPAGARPGQVVPPPVPHQTDRAP